MPKALPLLILGCQQQLSDVNGIRTMPRTKVHEPITPGEILETEFLVPLGITQYKLSQATGLSQTRISEIVRGKRQVTPETALRLSRALGVGDHFWVMIQLDYDLEVAHDKFSDVLATIRPLTRPDHVA